MPIKASLKAHKNGFYITFTPGIRVSMVQGGYGYEPRRPWMTKSQRQEFTAASAGITYDALIDALMPLGAELTSKGLYAYDIYTVLDTVMLSRSIMRGRSLEHMDDSQMSRVRSMMGTGVETPSTTDFDFDEALLGMGEPKSQHPWSQK